jgi:hypothetical protein
MARSRYAANIAAGPVATSEVHGRRSPAPAATAAVIAVYLLLSVLVWWHVWSAHPTTDMELGGDQWRFVWFLGWEPFAIGHGHFPLFSGWANVPGGVNLLSNAAAPALGVIFAPITLIWGAIATFNLLVTLSLSLSALSAYALCRHVGAGRIGAFAGGLLFGFGPSVITQDQGHLHLSFAAVLPLIFLCLYELLVRQRWPAIPTGILLGVLVTLQYLISSELLFDTAVVAVVAIIVTAIAGRHAPKQKVWWALRALAAGAVSSVVLVAFPVWFTLAGPAHVTGKLNLVPQAYRADLLGAVLPDRNQLITINAHLLAEANHFANSAAENSSYLGVPLLIVLLVGLLALRRNRTLVVAAIAGVAAFVLSLGGRLAISGPPALGPNGSAGGGVRMPELVFFHLPVLGSIEPVRFAFLVDLSAAVMLALVVTAIAEGRANGRRAGRRHGRSAGGSGRSRAGGAPAVAAAVVVVAFALVPLIPNAPFGAVGSTATPGYLLSSALRSQAAGGSVVLYPFPSDSFSTTLLWQQQAGFSYKMVGGDFIVPSGPEQQPTFTPLLGYAGSSVTGTTLAELAQGDPPPPSPQLKAAITGELRTFKAKELVALPAYGVKPGEALPYLEKLFGKPSHQAPDVDTWLWPGN